MQKNNSGTQTSKTTLKKEKFEFPKTSKYLNVDIQNVRTPFNMEGEIHPDSNYNTFTNAAKNPSKNKLLPVKNSKFELDDQYQSSVTQINSPKYTTKYTTHGDKFLNIEGKQSGKPK